MISRKTLNACVLCVVELSSACFTSGSLRAAWCSKNLHRITQPVIRVKILTLVCSIPTSLKFAFLSHSLLSQSGNLELMFVSVYHERGTMLSVHKDSLIYPQIAILPVMVRWPILWVKMKNFPRVTEKYNDGTESSPCPPIPDTLLSAAMLLLFTSGLILLSGLTLAGAHWPFFEGSWKLYASPWALLGDYTIRDYVFLLCEALTYV